MGKSFYVQFIFIIRSRIREIYKQKLRIIIMQYKFEASRQLRLQSGKCLKI